ncbi:unnamed protein product [Schistocephalus solidus]|uniref:Nucleoporin_C domain-containing protein n=1 Tax=Schistocephalus solidus TaxID=70667 RepID=A0A183T7H9_SCHSO|nr:unnamed protein product [Schistocephalus solidus]
MFCDDAVVAPVDILEPPWSPSREPPPPRKLKIFGLVPSSNPSSHFPSSFKAYGISGQQTAGRLLHLTNQVFCRPLTGLSPHAGGLSLSATLPITRRAQSSCPFQMREAPAELEQYSTGSGDAKTLGNQPDGGGGGSSILLALRQVAANGARVYGDYPTAARFNSVWSWWAWRGPTVRLWQFEGVRVRLQSDRLRQIPNLLLPAVGASVPESFAISYSIIQYFLEFPLIPASLYTTLSGTGERMYLSDMEEVHREGERMATSFDTNSFPNEYEHLVHQPVELDVTRLLPAWALRLTRLGDDRTGAEAVRDTVTALIYWNPRNGYPYLIGQRAGRVRIEVLATPQDTQPLALANVEIVDAVFNKFVALKAECVVSVTSTRSVLHASCENSFTSSTVILLETVGLIFSLEAKNELTPIHAESWMITLSGRLEPHPSADQFLRVMPDVYASEMPSHPILSNEQEMTADFTMPHPRILNLDVRGQDPNDPKVVTGATDSANFLGDSTSNISSNSAVCPMGKVSLTLRMTDGKELLLHELPRGQVRVSAPSSASYSSSGPIKLVWDPADLLKIGPLTEEGKALVSTGKLGLGPLVDMNEITLWSASENCRPRPLVAIGKANLEEQEDPGPAKQVFDWEEAAIRKYREFEAGHLGEVNNLPSQAHFVRSSQFHTSRSSIDRIGDRDSAQGDSSPVKQILLGIVAFSVLFLTVNFIVVIALRRHRARRRKLARIQEDLCHSTKDAFGIAPPPNSPGCPANGGPTSVASLVLAHSQQHSTIEASSMPQHYINGGPCDQSNSTVSGYNPMTNGNAQAAMNAGLSCSSVFSAGSGGSKQQHQQQSAMYSCYSNQTAYMSNIDTPPPMTLMTWVANSSSTAGACGGNQAWGSSQGSNGSRSLHSDPHGSQFGASPPHMPYPMPNHPEKNPSAYVPRDHSKGLSPAGFKWQSSVHSHTFPDNLGSVPSSVHTGSPIHDDGFVSGTIENPSVEGSNNSTVFFPHNCDSTGKPCPGRMPFQPLPSQKPQAHDQAELSSPVRYCHGEERGRWAPPLLQDPPMLSSPSCGCHLLQTGSPRSSQDAAPRSSPSSVGEITRGGSFSTHPNATGGLPISSPCFSCMERSNTTEPSTQNGILPATSRNRLLIPSPSALRGMSSKLQPAGSGKSAKGPVAILPTRLTLAHDPNVLGFKYHTEPGLMNFSTPQYPPAVLLPSDVLKMQPNSSNGGFVGEMEAVNDGTLIDASEAFADSGRESQEKSSSSINSTDAVPDLPAPIDGDSTSSVMDIQAAQVDV